MRAAHELTILFEPLSSSPDHVCDLTLGRVNNGKATMRFSGWSLLKWLRYIGGGIAAVLLVSAFIAAIAWGVAIVALPSEKTQSQSNFAGAEQQQKRLVIFLDGTWNDVDTNTNVWRMRALCASKGKDGKPQLIYYERGVNGALGGIFGKGLDDNIRLAYEWLIENYNAGDEVYIFGFSRGAFTARSLAGLVSTQGILKVGSPIGLTELFNRYKAGNEERTIWALKAAETAGEASKSTPAERMFLKYSQPTNVALVGVWDTVGSIGWKAGHIPGFSRSTFSYLQTGLFFHILNAYHALAIDEQRADFAPTLWDVRKGHLAPPRSIANVEQRWFVGAHSNVGGGNEHDLLPQAPLRWMMKKAELQGLTFRSEVDVDGDALKEEVTNSYKDFLHGFYRVLSWKPYVRPIGQEPYLLAGQGIRVNVNETIDASVFERWQKNPSYRPTNLSDWAKRKGVDLAQLHTSVRADDPHVPVPDQ
jgi:uncharacterized protein (DUF2235 family)